MNDDRLTTEVIGFRQWTVDADLRLKSAGQNYAWEKGVNTACCMPSVDSRDRRHKAPGKQCDCGLYALHSPDFWYGPDASNRHGMWLALSVGGEREYIAGLVSAWGKLEVHADGFRAQHAQVVAIAIPEGKKAAVIARAVAQEYGVPMVPQSELERVASEFGSTVPEDLRPEKQPPAEDFYAAAMRMFSANRSQYWGGGLVVSGTTANVPMWTSTWTTIDPAEEPPPATVNEAIRRMKEPKYDPRQFQPKRKGGKR